MTRVRALLVSAFIALSLLGALAAVIDAFQVELCHGQGLMAECHVLEGVPE